MGKNDKKQPKRKGQPDEEFLELPAVVCDALTSTVISAGVAHVRQVLEAERAAICGPRYTHNPDRKAFRAGYVPAELKLAGRRVRVTRPRARSVDGHEVPLPSWEAFNDSNLLTERAMQQMLLGVSTRKYGDSLEPLPDGFMPRGMSSSAVSRRFIEGTKNQLKVLLSRDLSDLNLACLMIDGIHFEEHVLIAAIGIDLSGVKYVLGLWDGATENGATCRALLSSMVERGLDPGRPYLFALDGSKALRSAVQAVFGNNVIVQRCQQHKKRNVLDQLPRTMRSSVRRAMGEAYKSKTFDTARRRLLNLARRLERDYPGAAASLREGLEETLTVIRLKLTPQLQKTFGTTNIVENAFGFVRDVSRRVKYWQGGAMIMRWTASALIQAESRFNRVTGYRHMHILVQALEEQGKATLDVKAKAA